MKILAITTSRADWNSLGMVALALREQGSDIELAAIGDHAGLDIVRAEWGDLANGVMSRMSVDRLEAIISEGSDPDPRSIAQRPTVFTYGPDEISMDTLLERDGIAIAGLESLLRDRSPNMALLCGDRHETLCAAFCAAMMGIPVAHLAGGDVSGGSLDEGWRHAITKIASLHFPTNPESAARIIRMGENPADIHMLGSASIDRLVKTPIMPLGETVKALGLPDARPFILANWQAGTSNADVDLLQVLFALGESRMPGVFVGLNNDPWAGGAARRIESFIALNPTWQAHHNLSPELYLSALAHCSCLIGNSSSGFYEAPYYGTAVINVGKRQEGRSPAPACMIQIPEADAGTILKVMASIAEDGGFKEPMEMLYGSGDAGQKIAAAILNYEGHVFRKRFHDN